MDLNEHRWDLSPKEAVALQRRMADRVVRECRPERVTTVAGIDVSVKNDTAVAAVVVLDYPSLDVLDSALAHRTVTFPYIPGLLSFREGPVIIKALEKLSRPPDRLIFDGQGIAHPRRLGIASHIGLLVDLPAIGCAKSRLCGRHEEPGRERGSRAPLVDRGETIGAVVRTKTGVKPVFVSVGHLMDLASSIDFVLNCCRGFRLPETTRLAHRLAGDRTSFLRPSGH